VGLVSLEQLVSLFFGCFLFLSSKNRYLPHHYKAADDDDDDDGTMMMIMRSDIHPHCKATARSQYSENNVFYKTGLPSDLQNILADYETSCFGLSLRKCCRSALIRLKMEL
jgi:hypothetical protein